MQWVKWKSSTFVRRVESRHLYLSMQSVELDVKNTSETNGHTPAVRVTFAPENSTSERPPFLAIHVWPQLIWIVWLYCYHKYPMPWLQVIFITISILFTAFLMDKTDYFCVIVVLNVYLVNSVIISGWCEISIPESWRQIWLIMIGHQLTMLIFLFFVFCFLVVVVAYI